MSHTVFHTAQIPPINTQVPSKPRASSSSIRLPVLLGPTNPEVIRLPVKLQRVLVVKAFADGHPMELLERCFRVPLPSGCLYLSSIMAPVMKGGKYGSFGAVTLEKSKLDTSQKQSQSSPEVCLIDYDSFLLNLISGIFVLGYKGLGCLEIVGL